MEAVSCLPCCASRGARPGCPEPVPGGPLRLIAGPAGPARDGLFDVGRYQPVYSPGHIGPFGGEFDGSGFFAPCLACVISIMLSKLSMKVNDPSLI